MTELLERPGEAVVAFAQVAAELTWPRLPARAAVPGTAGVSWALARCGARADRAAAGPPARTVTIGGQVRAGRGRIMTPGWPLAGELPGSDITPASGAGQACRADLFSRAGCDIALTGPRESASPCRRLPGTRS